MTGQLGGRVRPLRSGRHIAEAIAALTRLDHVGDANPKPLRDYCRAQIIQRKHAITQVLPIRLATTPHSSLRSIPETDESHRSAVPEPPALRFQSAVKRSKARTAARAGKSIAAA
jgi:hypothetical protein